MFLALNYFIIIKFHIAETEIILIKKINYSKHCLNIKVNNIYKINIYIFICLNRADIVKILNIY